MGSSKKDQIVPNETFYPKKKKKKTKNIFINLAPTTAPFTVENFKKNLRVDPEL